MFFRCWPIIKKQKSSSRNSLLTTGGDNLAPFLSLLNMIIQANIYTVDKKSRR